jgi:hypothetical protein
LKDGNRLRVFENRMLRRIFGPKRDDLAGGCTKLLHNSPKYYYCDQIREVEMGGTCNTHEGDEN